MFTGLFSKLANSYKEDRLRLANELRDKLAAGLVLRPPFSITQHQSQDSGELGGLNIEVRPPVPPLTEQQLNRAIADDIATLKAYLSYYEMLDAAFRWMDPASPENAALFQKPMPQKQDLT